MVNWRGIAGLLLLGIVLYASIIFCSPIYQRLWLQYVTLNFPLVTLQYFGYLNLSIGIVCGIGFVATKREHSFRRNGFAIASLLFVIVSIPLMIPQWFYAFWYF